MNNHTISSVDAHLHFWDPQTTPRELSPLLRLVRSPRIADWIARRFMGPALRAFFADPSLFTRPYLHSEFQRDAGKGAGEFIHVEAGWLGDPVDETRWLESLPPRTGRRLRGIVARAELDAPEVDELLDGHLAASDKIVGIRDMLCWHSDESIFRGTRSGSLIRDPKWLEGFEALGRRALAFEATLFSEQLPDLLELARRHPEQVIVISHAGTPVGAAGPFCGVGRSQAERQNIVDDWKANMLELASCPKVYVKLSGLLMPCVGFGFEHRAKANTDEVVEALEAWIDFLIDAFGAERCLFGSNFPVEGVSVAYETLWAAYRRIAAKRSAEEQDELFGGTARRAFIPRAEDNARTGSHQKPTRPWLSHFAHATPLPFV